MQEKQETCKINVILQEYSFARFAGKILAPFLVGDFASLQDKYLLAILYVLAKKEFSCINQT